MVPKTRAVTVLFCSFLLLCEFFNSLFLIQVSTQKDQISPPSKIYVRMENHKLTREPPGYIMKDVLRGSFFTHKNTSWPLPYTCWHPTISKDRVRDLAFDFGHTWSGHIVLERTVQSWALGSGRAAATAFRGTYLI
jgi:hypothetical protein